MVAHRPRRVRIPPPGLEGENRGGYADVRWHAGVQSHSGVPATGLASSAPRTASSAERSGPRRSSDVSRRHARPGTPSRSSAESLRSTPGSRDSCGRPAPLGFARIGVQTNGWALAAAGRVESLARAGLTDVHLSIHGAEARVHDWHAGRTGAFDAALRTMTAARAAGLDRGRRDGPDALDFPRPRAHAPPARVTGCAAWCIEIPRWRGLAATDADRVVPRLALALPFALARARRARRPSGSRRSSGAPRRACWAPSRRVRSSDARSFGAPCAACPSRRRARGSTREYLARFGESELAPCSPVAATRGTEVAAMFVGVGEIAPPDDAARVAAPPERARVALPVLGRPAPARGEVPASTPKQSGEALRAILPELFDDDDSGEPDARLRGVANIGYLQLVRHCNQYCRFCSNPATGWSLDLDTARRAVDDFAERGYFGIILTGGEPSLSPIVADVTRHAVARGLHVRMITNGSTLAAAGRRGELRRGGPAALPREHPLVPRGARGLPHRRARAASRSRCRRSRTWAGPVRR